MLFLHPPNTFGDLFLSALLVHRLYELASVGVFVFLFSNTRRWLMIIDRFLCFLLEIIWCCPFVLAKILSLVSRLERIITSTIFVLFTGGKIYRLETEIIVSRIFLSLYFNLHVS